MEGVAWGEWVDGGVVSGGATGMEKAVGRGRGGKGYEGHKCEGLGTIDLDAPAVYLDVGMEAGPDPCEREVVHP